MKIAQWTAGDSVIVRAMTCTVARVEQFADCQGLQLTPRSLPDIPFGTLLIPFDRPRDPERSARPRSVRARRWLHEVRRMAAADHPFGGLRCAARARIDLMPYQLEPALAMLRHGRLRMLIADSVGLGKTIQAGLIVAEVLAQNSTPRALVVVPAGLRHQWQSELALHFKVDAPVCDAAWLRDRTRELPYDVNPWALPGAYLVSLDFLKRAEVLNALEELLWDIVVIDEAHLVNSGTDRRAAVDAVATRARRVVLLTGTPHSGDEAQFEALCRIGEGPARTPLVLFRRGRGVLGSGVARRSSLLRVRTSDAERVMHELLERYALRLWRESRTRRDRRAALVAIVLRKRALSSAGSLALSVARRLELLSRHSQADTVQLSLPLQPGDDVVEDAVPDDVLAVPGLANAALERRWLGALREAARRASRAESKLARLRKLLARTAEPAIVFTEYRDTLVRLQRALASIRSPVLALHGGMSATERRAVQQSFNEQPALLLATDAASEGLNLHRLCRLVVHFELPWNPLRLEQRTGRVDRIGQSRRVHEIALVADDTAERIVLAPLARRARKAQTVAPPAGRMLHLLSESHVADAVMTGDTRTIADPIGVRISWDEMQLTSAARDEAARLVQQRQWLQSARDAPPRERPAVTLLRTRTSADPSQLVLLYALSIISAGRVTHSERLLLGLTLRPGLPTERSDAATLRLLDELLHAARPQLDTIVSDRLRDLEATVAPTHNALLTSLGARELAILEGRPSAARQLVQAGLFDRRAVREKERREVADRDRREEAGRSLESLAAALPLTGSAKLRAALIRCGPHR